MFCSNTSSYWLHSKRRKRRRRKKAILAPLWFHFLPACEPTRVHVLFLSRKLSSRFSVTAIWINHGSLLEMKALHVMLQLQRLGCRQVIPKVFLRLCFICDPLKFPSFTQNLFCSCLMVSFCSGTSLPFYMNRWCRRREDQQQRPQE